jgi:hypothetical protein
MKRLGMNISGQSYYDSSQMLRNLVFRNPGFEGEIWQSILKCVAVTSTSCTDMNSWAQWPANFVQGASYEFIYGGAAGQTGTVTSSTAASSGANQGVTINFAQGGKTPKAIHRLAGGRVYREALRSRLNTPIFRRARSESRLCVLPQQGRDSQRMSHRISTPMEAIPSFN